MARKLHLKRSSAADSLRSRLAKELDQQQFDAVVAPGGFHLILAGPGSGKTRVITSRVAYLIASGLPAETILLVTFTRRAAREMIVRLEELIGSEAHRVWAGTFHHIGNRILRRNAAAVGLDSNFSILDGEDQTGLVRLAMEDAGLVGKNSSASGLRADSIARLFSLAFNTGRTIPEVIANQQPEFTPWTKEILQASLAYANRKRQTNVVDYDDLLGLWARLLEDQTLRDSLSKSFRHILVDELQDTNVVQMTLLENMARAGWGNLTGVGDDAQAIYRFRGANYDNMLRFPERNPECEIHRLESNYRSTPEIVSFVNAAIAPSVENFPKTLISRRDPGRKPELIAAADAHEEADAVISLVQSLAEEDVRLGDMAVLYRNSYDSTVLEEKLLHERIPYEVRAGLRFFEKAHIKDALAFLRILANPRDQIAWDRLLLMLDGVGPAASGRIRAALFDKDSPLLALESSEAMGRVPPKAKGAFATFVADLRAIRATRPETCPADGVAAILRGHYPAFARRKYADLNPENRLKEIEQLAVLASRYDNLDKFLDDLVLAGDLYGQETLDADPRDHLVLSTIHQAKGLEWSRVFVLRLVDGGFPNDRSLREPGGEEEERRIFYVASSRARDELYLSYALTVFRPGVGAVLSRPSRFLSSIDRSLYDDLELESDNDMAWTTGFHSRQSRPSPKG